MCLANAGKPVLFGKGAKDASNSHELFCEKPIGLIDPDLNESPQAVADKFRRGRLGQCLAEARLGHQADKVH
jgi:hypothetical protein